ncbi:protein fem-1 homolog B isoform X1 [Harmonia axyridis]|uniref:protein fem-1 homolog B isoform X1 n=1 Tax=Harmonia axyridis TaxID=115357 RepID=UPI001E2778AF|nr:protein fem-1 homolog B isoform X1 [Harmonia axyridis]
MSRANLKNRIYHAAKDDMSIALYSLLSSKEAENLVNEKLTTDDHQKVTPLMVAALNGSKNVIRMLLENFNLDLEVEGTVKFEGYVIEGASPLWCASCAGHLEAVKILVSAGADVNHPTKTKSTPLRAACFDGRLDIVKYLVMHKADFNIANKYNNTCLMIAAYKGHVDVVKFLLEQGSDPNEKALCGATALHFAAECGFVEVVKELLKYGATFSANDACMTPLKAAAERTREGVVKYLINQPFISLEERVEALELLGASIANDKESYNIQKAYMYMHMSMRLRYSDPLKPIKKKLITPIPAYDNWVECQTINELEAIGSNTNALHMEALTIRERILGVNSPELPHPVIFRGAVFADDARFDRCLDLWMHALYLKQKNYISVPKDLLRFAQVFSQMLHVGVRVNHNIVVRILSSAITELERNKEKMIHPGPKDDPDSVLEDIDSNLTTTLYLLNILTKLMKQCSEEEIFNIKRMVFTLNQLNMINKDGQTLLHLACNSETPVDDFHTINICQFPCAETTNLLINCGADVNTMDLHRNTPLHIIVNYPRPISDFHTLNSIITYLTLAGAHMDCVNELGETPLESAATGSVAEIILQGQIKLSLKCLAANAVKRHKLKYKGVVPKLLESFVDLHGPVN